MRIIFMGTPAFAVPTLAEIVGHGHDVVACYTKAPAPAGRGMAIKRSPVHVMAEEVNIPVLTPKSLRHDEALTQFAAHDADIAVVVAYGLLLPKAILTTPTMGCLNLHGSLLPRWRGAAPIQRAIMAGDAETGVAVMRMEEGLDTGPVAMMERLPIPLHATSSDIHDQMSLLGADLMIRALAAMERGALSFTPQLEEGVTYAKKILNDEARIDWSQPALHLHNLVRGLSPFPGAFFEADLGKGVERVKVLRAAFEVASFTAPPATLLDDQGLIATGEGNLRLLQVQRAGKGPVSAQDFIRGARVKAGDIVG
jgi:methionyl-tRNA formyltransferase